MRTASAPGKAGNPRGIPTNTPFTKTNAIQPSNLTNQCAVPLRGKPSLHLLDPGECMDHSLFSSNLLLVTFLYNRPPFAHSASRDNYSPAGKGRKKNKGQTSTKSLSDLTSHSVVQPSWWRAATCNPPAGNESGRRTNRV